MKSITNIIVSSVLLLFVLDLYLLGGGRVVDFGGVTLRMVVFAIMLLMAIFSLLLTMRINSLVLNTVFCASAILLVGMFISTANGNAREGAVSISAYSFVLLPLVFYFFQNKIFMFLDNYIRISAIFLSSSYLLLVCVIYTGTISISDVFNFLPESEIFLRGESALVYKGFIFILIGALHLALVKRGPILLRSLGIVICLLATVATLTRGFVISFIIVILIYVILNAKSVLLKYFIGFLLVILPFATYSSLLSYFSRAGSDDVRLNDLSLFMDYLNADVFRMFLGGGVSTFLGERAGIENAYMDITLRFGLLGLFFVLLVFILIWKNYLQIMSLKLSSINKSKINWLFYTVLLLYIQSNFNPYINNYIGGTFVLFVLVYFDTFLKNTLSSINSVVDR
ncbi:hypothetical protein ACET68_19975 [Aeromonas rivipollensis]|uniref:hypothetical protein n=1 Tax=Aeromonas rivipollensis TaxID=948519 RepID=UPI0038CFD5DB